MLTLSVWRCSKADSRRYQIIYASRRTNVDESNHAHGELEVTTLVYGLEVMTLVYALEVWEVILLFTQITSH